MARSLERQKAIDLRKEGKTYSQIKQQLGISKSTLSDWLSKYPLTEAQLLILSRNKINSRYVAIEKTRNVKQKKWENRLEKTYIQEKEYWLTLSQRDVELAGLFLYWGEGSKTLNGIVSLNNCDPKVMRFTLYWFKYGLHVPEEAIRVQLHLYSDMNIDKEIVFWSEKLQLPRTQFRKPYVKQSRRVELTHKGFGHGTCGISVNNTLLKEKILMAINAIADSCSVIV